MSIAIRLTSTEASKVAKTISPRTTASTQDATQQLFLAFYDAARSNSKGMLFTLYLPEHLSDALTSVRSTMTSEGVGTRQPIAGLGTLVQRIAEGLLLQGRTVVPVGAAVPLNGSTHREFRRW